MAEILETKRLILRDVCEADWERFVAAFKDPLAQDGLLSFQAQDEQIERDFANALLLAQQTTRVSYAPAIVLKQQNLLIGTCSLSQTFLNSFHCRLGWHVTSAYQGQGYATEAARALVKLAFAHHQVARLYAECFATNLASRRVMEKLGMTLHRSTWLLRWLRGATYGEQRPIVRYHLRQTQWQALQVKTRNP